MTEVISRDEAFARGLKKYFTGEPCKLGHVTDRYTSNGGCVSCINKYTVKGVNARNTMRLPLPVILPSDRMPTPELVKFFQARLIEVAPQWCQDFDRANAAPQMLATDKAAQVGGLDALFKAGWTLEQLLAHGYVTQVAQS